MTQKTASSTKSQVFEISIVADCWAKHDLMDRRLNRKQQVVSVVLRFTATYGRSEAEVVSIASLTTLQLFERMVNSMASTKRPELF